MKQPSGKNIVLSAVFHHEGYRLLIGAHLFLIFAPLMALQKKDQSLLGKLRSKYRLVILNDDTFEEKLSFKLSRLNVFVALGFLTILLIGGTTLLIAFTSLREYIPGYSSTRLKRQAYELSLVTDSLSNQIANNALYLRNIQRIIKGEPMSTHLDTPDVEGSQLENLTMQASPTDSAFRQSVEEEERFSLSNKGNQNTRVLTFFTPLKGMVINSFNPSENHLGIDVVANENEVIKAAQEGTVLFSEWTVENGYVLIIQHPEKFVSVYKHNSALLKAQGQKVKIGEPVAIVGSTGNFSSGPHLHFELWLDGFAVNPESYLHF